MKMATLATTIAPQPTRDFATERGTYVMELTTVGEYLERLGLYDPSSRTTRRDASITADFQRAVLPISKNPIKARMLRDLLRGGTLPPLVLYDRDQKQRPQIVDGIQRTDVLTEALTTLLTLGRGDLPQQDFALVELAVMKQLGQSPKTADEFLTRPIILQVWRDLDRDELVRLFMVLNVGQQKVSPRHLLEVIGADLRQMFESWGLKLITEREEKQQGRRPGRRSQSVPEPAVVPGITHFRYEYLLDGLKAYAARDPQVKTTKILEQAAKDTPDLELDQRITEIGSEFCRADFRWVCLELNKLIQERYKENPRWRIAIQNSDNFFIPLMAALGDTRHNPKAQPFVEDRKAKLLQLVNAAGDPDPLWLSRNDPDSLASILERITSNIGRRQRGVVYNAWRRYFRFGAEDSEYPIEWRTALLSD